MIAVKTGLVLEGGGMRGLYTIGVLDAMMEYHLWTDYVIGVSAGACNGISYVSRQQYRTYRIDEDYLKDKRYVSIQNFIKTRSLFGMDFIFSEIPERLNVFDHETFLSSPIEFVTGVTDMQTGEPAYFGKQQSLKDMCMIVRASSSIPMFSPPVEFRGKYYLDGGTSDPIPVKQALRDGCTKLLVVRTRDRGYRKTPEGGRAVYGRVFRDTPGMIRCIDRRHLVYNDQLRCCERMERAGQALILAPERPIHISRFENDIRKLDVLYREGWNAVERQLSQLKDFLGENKEEHA